MPCLLALLAVAFPRIAIVLLWLFTGFFSHVYTGIIIPVLGFLFLPLTLIVYTFFGGPHTAMSTQELVFLFIAVILDLGFVGGGPFGRSRRYLSVAFLAENRKPRRRLEFVALFRALSAAIQGIDAHVIE